MCILAFLSDVPGHGKVWTEEVVEVFVGGGGGVLLEVKAYVSVCVEIFRASV